MRHPKLCRNSSKLKQCQFKEGCAYLHKDRDDDQAKLNDQMMQGILKHEKDITALTEEVISLKNLVQQLSLELVKFFQPEVAIANPENEKVPENENIEAPSPEKVLKCKECEFTSDKENILKKHMNMQHTNQKMKKSDGHENGVNFVCDECPFSSKTKKSLKKHKEKDHITKKATNDIKN